MDICLIRHTRPQVEKGVCYGRLDLDVAETFEQEAVISANLLPHSFDYTYSSPLRRCRKLANFFGSNYVLDDRLQEVDFGAWEGRLWTDIGESALDMWMANIESFIFPGGEAFAQFQVRVEQFLAQLPVGRVLLITHAGVIKIAYGILANKSLSESVSFSVDYGQCLRVVDGLPELLTTPKQTLLSRSE